MNIHYIRAAVEAATGIHLSLKELRSILLELGMITKRQAKNMIFPGYKSFYPKDSDKKDRRIVPVDTIMNKES